MFSEKIICPICDKEILAKTLEEGVVFFCKKTVVKKTHTYILALTHDYVSERLIYKNIYLQNMHNSKSDYKKSRILIKSNSKIKEVSVSENYNDPKFIFQNYKEYLLFL